MIMLRVLWLPTTVTLVTLAWIFADRRFGWHGPHHPLLGAALIIVGTLLAIACAMLLFVHGKGSPHPFVHKTKRIVDVGPYGMVRNPMMWAIGGILVGLAVLLGSVGLWIGIAWFVTFVAVFVPLYEERDMRRRFGEEYDDYCRRVPRWVPRLRHKHADEKKRAAHA
jgi:protein-S-isoprenylcysteine O-methyltransferase Ste14